MDVEGFYSFCWEIPGSPIQYPMTPADQRQTFRFNRFSAKNHLNLLQSYSLLDGFRLLRDTVETMGIFLKFKESSLYPVRF
jgi:hypothetical protein